MRKIRLIFNYIKKSKLPTKAPICDAVLLTLLISSVFAPFSTRSLQTSDLPKLYREKV